MKSKRKKNHPFAGLLFWLVCGCAWPSQHAAAQGLITTMAEQIAKLELVLQEAKQGYSIVQKGLNTISSIKQGDFDLHSLFFSSLKDVNPAIKGWGKVADIMAMQIQILLGCSTVLSTAASSGSFSASDLTYLTAVVTNLKSLTGEDIDELTSLVTDGNWQMTDDERMSKIDQLFNRVADKYTFLQSFSRQISQQSQNRTHEKISLQNLTQLFQP